MYCEKLQTSERGWCSGVTRGCVLEFTIGRLFMKNVQVERGVLTGQSACRLLAYAIGLTFELLCSMNSANTISSNFAYSVGEFVTSKWFCQLFLLLGRQGVASQVERADEVQTRPKPVQVC